MLLFDRAAPRDRLQPRRRQEREDIMFYEPDKDNHGLRYNPFKSIAVPPPIEG
jgi:hypothetical protein